MIREFVNCLENGEDISKTDLLYILKNYKKEEQYIKKKAREITDKIYGKKVYIRGLIEVSNICKNNCFYCGIRRENKNLERYRLSKKEILDCCENGYVLGFRTFVLQGGEDEYYTDKILVDIVSSIKQKYPDCAITLSLGEREKSSYKELRAAGADRYLLRHETATQNHYRKLHPKEMSWEHRIQCLEWLKEFGYQVGCGFMVGSPFQTYENLIEELLFIKKMQPAMVGIGPFLSHKDTPFATKENGNLDITLLLLSLIRIMNKNVLLPATTALATLDPKGRELGILAGANVVMPNLSPVVHRKKYALYDGKACMGSEAAESLVLLEETLNGIGYHTVVDRGDVILRETFRSIDLK